MNIKHRWSNRNTVPVTVKIYRSTSVIDRNNLGSPIATLTQGETEWIDTTAVKGTLYYYVYEAITANDRDVSQNVKAYANYRLGPGPNTFQVGDLNYGYFGELETVEFITAGTLIAGVKMTVGSALTAANNSLKWHKFARNGKILFVPNQVLVQTLSWMQLYNLGLVYGTDDAGKGNFLPSPTVLQNTRIKIGPDTFKVRLMTGYSDDLNDIPATVPSDNDPTDSFLCEWEDLVFPLCNVVPNKQRLVNVAAYTPAQMGLTVRPHMQERASSTTNVFRGSSSSSTVRAAVSLRGATTSTAAISSFGWWPVLELINE